tara:strand:- start:322 stop:1071 length:750 start_codon:yes stop_codon:yes gene_type:complete
LTSTLNGKVALITGASSGIGEATAESLAALGAKVSLVARREDRLKALQEKIAGTGGEALVVKADMSKQQDIIDAVAKTKDQWGRLDILVNNAGVMYLGPINGADTREWKSMVEVNLLGLMYCTHEALPIMIEQGSGHIVNISSVSGRVVTARSGVYNATKFGVGAFSEALRQEVYKRNIRVTIIEPGAVLTELSDHISHAESKERLKTWVAEMEALTSKDIANSIVYAVSQPDNVNVNEILIRPTEQSI